MGPIQQGVNQTIRSISVAVGAVKANKVANKVLDSGEDAGAATTSGGDVANTMISEANDATKNEMMGQKAMLNAEKLKNWKLRNKKLRAEIRALKKEPGGSK